MTDITILFGKSREKGQRYTILDIVVEDSPTRHIFLTLQQCFGFRDIMYGCIYPKKSPPLNIGDDIFVKFNSNETFIHPDDRTVDAMRISQIERVPKEMQHKRGHNIVQMRAGNVIPLRPDG